MSHSRNPNWKHGEHWVVCDVCGFEYRHSAVKLRWDGLVTCKEDWEVRHPQDFVHGVTDDFAAKGLVRPPPADTLTGPTYPVDVNNTIPPGTFKVD